MRGRLSETYLIALGSNMRSARFGPPTAVLRKALECIASAGNGVVAVSPFIRSRPLGPSRRDFVNAAAVVETMLPPLRMLDLLQEVEMRLGRRHLGQPWGPRVVDLDIVMWCGGKWNEGDLAIPHPRFRERAFVLGPAAAVAPAWRDPLTGLTIAQLHARLTRPHRVTTSRACQTQRLGP